MSLLSQQILDVLAWTLTVSTKQAVPKDGRLMYDHNVASNN